MKKKIMFFMFSLAGGGAERTIVNIINNIDKTKFEVMLILGQRKNNEYLDLVSSDVKVQYLDCTRVKYCILKLRKVILKEEPNFVFSTLNPNNVVLTIANMLTFSKKSKVVIREANNRSQSGKVNFPNKILTFLTYNFLADKVIALSHGVKDDLVNSFRISSQKIKVIYNPVEIDKIKRLSNETVEEIINKEKEKIIIAVGRLVEQKDLSTLIKAFALVDSKIASRLVILGIGPLENELKKLSRDLDVANKIIFLGFKKNPYKYIFQSDLFVLSSKWEGFGHVIVEAMACATPVVSTDCKSGPGEIIGDNEYGVLSPVGDVEELARNIIKLLTNETLSNTYVRKGLERATNFKADSITNEYQNLFL